MGDTKSGRDEQADDEEQRQRERELAEALDRGDEPEPVDPGTLADLEAGLDDLEYPATGTDLVAAVGEYEVTTSDGTYALADLIPDTEAETFDSPAAVSVRVERPTVAAAMTRIIEASRDVSGLELGASQRAAYEKTFRALQAVDTLDDDEGVVAITDWVVDRIEATDDLPGSRAVRRRAAKYARANDYSVSADEWLGI